MQHKKKYVVVKSNKGAGLGDNLCAVFAGIAVAVFYGRKLIVDWSDGSFGELGVNTFPIFFELSPLISSDLSISDLNSLNVNVHPPAWSGNLLQHSYELYLQQNWDTYQRARTIEVLSSDPTYFNSDIDILVITDFSRLPHNNSLMSLASLIARNIKPSQKIQDLLDKYIRLNLGVPYIGVHVRMTDEKGAREKQRKYSDYIKLLRRIKSNNISLSKIFLATDNTTVIDSWKKDFPDLVFRQKAMPKPGDPLHLTEFAVPRFEVTIDAVLDMLILSKSTFLLFPDNSSFSLSSAMLSGLPSGNINAIPFRPTSSLAFRLISRLKHLLLHLFQKVKV